MSDRESTTPLTAKKGLASRNLSTSPTARRSSRVAIDMPVEIFGQASSGKVFREETRTIVVNAHGALLMMTSIPLIKPSVLLVNKKTRTEAQCRVIFQKETEPGKGEMSVEFVDPQPRFWGIAFPPEDWNNADRKKPPSITR